MRIIFLGTSAAIPSKDRNLPSTALLLNNGDIILFDTGEDVQRRFIAAGLKMNVPLYIFIGHLHGDHIIGLPGLLFHFGLIGRTAPLYIYGPRGLFMYIIWQKYTIGLNPPYPVNIYEILPEHNRILEYTVNMRPDTPPVGRKIESHIICNAENFIMKAYAVDHTVETYGFRFEEKMRPGKFNPRRAEELGIPKRFWKKLQHGNIIEYNGKKIDPAAEGIIGRPRRGFIISYSSDTYPCKNLEVLAEGSDIFICESTYSSSEEELARQKKHMTARMAAEIAKKCGVSRLYLTHISTRYADPGRDTVLLEDARSVFENAYLARDLMNIELKYSQIDNLEE